MYVLLATWHYVTLWIGVSGEGFIRFSGGFQ